MVDTQTALDPKTKAELKAKIDSIIEQMKSEMANLETVKKKVDLILST